MTSIKKKITKRYFAVTFLMAIIIFSCSEKVNGNKVSLVEQKITAPFGEIKINTPNFEKCERFVITDYGAINGDKENTTKALLKAIEKANASGGGIVEVPKGEWETKAIHLKSNVNLHLQKGAVLSFSEIPTDYLPEVQTTWEGMECLNYSPLIYAYNCKNIAITGEGKLKAKLDVWHKWFARPQNHLNGLKKLYHLSSENSAIEARNMVLDSANFRPQFIQFNRCENILMENVSIENSPFWTIHPFLSKHITLRNLNIMAHGHNNDGVDPEMSQNILIENCVFDQGDDAIAVKSGRNQDAWRLNTPSKNIVMRNCVMKNGHQLLAIGSELSGGIENVYVTNCSVADNANMFHLVFIKTNERRGGYVKNIFVENIKANATKKGVLGIETDVLYQWRNLVPTVETKLTPISDVYLKNIQVNKTEYVSKISGDENLPIQNVSLENIRVDSLMLSQKHIHKHLENFKEY